MPLFLDKWLSLLVTGIVLTIIFSVEYRNGGIEPVKELIPFAISYPILCLPLIWLGDYLSEKRSMPRGSTDRGPRRRAG